MFIRSLSQKLQDAAQSFPCLVLTGARQVGKTTLLRMLFPSHSYVTLDIPSQAAQAEGNPSDFLLNHPSPVIIDEIQYAPSLFRYIKSVIDENRHKMGSYVLTGSQKFTLMQGVSESLAGRCAIFELENLRAQELREIIKPPYSTGVKQKLVARGGYPELWRQENMNREDFYRSYLSTYLERDVRQIINVVHLRDFERFLRACALRSGSLLNKADLARDVGISPATANEWLSVLEASNQILLLEPWFSNGSKRMAKLPKMYLTDSGLLCYLLGVFESDWLSSPLAGAIWETFVFAELRKSLWASTIGNWQGRLWFYRDAQGVEADFLIEGAKSVTLIEAKAREVLSLKDAAQLQKIASHVGDSLLHKNKKPTLVVCGFPQARHSLNLSSPLQVNKAKATSASANPLLNVIAIHGFELGEWLHQDGI